MRSLPSCRGCAVGAAGRRCDCEGFCQAVGQMVSQLRITLVAQFFVWELFSSLKKVRYWGCSWSVHCSGMPKFVFLVFAFFH